MNLDAISEPGFKLGIFDYARAIVIYYLELGISKLLYTDPTRFWETS